MELELLLAHADDQRPVLDGGLPLESASGEPRPEEDKEPGSFGDFSADPNDLSLQRWGLIAPEGPEGDRLLDLVEPLRRQREEDQGGAPVRIYRVPAGMDTAAAVRWKKHVYWDESVPEDDLPRYLLTLGDLDRVSLELQQVLASDLFIGRLTCPTDEGYAAYVDKVLRWERAPSSEPQARALFFTARDGTAATTIGHKALVSPSVERCRERQQKRAFPAKEIEEIAYEGAPEARDALFEKLGRPEPSMLFTMSHGLGAPRGGWRSADEARAVQGAMSLGGGLRIDAADVAGQPFLPGGIWFFLACYGGGTPEASAYYHWLARLREVGGFGGRVDAVLAGLPRHGDRPFIAALPQAALANPRGPLAVMAHIDLAWTYSFQDMGAEGRGRPSRFQGIFRSLVDGARSGTSYQQLLRFLSETSVELSTLYDEEARLETAGKSLGPDNARGKEKANLWMLRQDLAGYLLLGDPATRLPLSRDKAPRAAPPPPELRSPAVATPAEPQASTPAAAKGPTPARDSAAMEEAVIAALIGEETQKAIADRHGITRAELQRWVETYRATGRAALGKLS